MAYKAVFNDGLYLCHGPVNNLNRWPKGTPGGRGGQYKNGDGDHDGTINDHAHRRKGDSHYQYEPTRKYQNSRYYQNSGRNYNVKGGKVEDGPHLTRAGMQRWEKEKQKNAQKAPDKRVKNVQDLADPDKWVIEDLSNREKAALGIKTGAESASKLVGKVFKDPPHERWDLSTRTDQELMSAINRERLERQYNDYFNPQLENEGRKYYQDKLATAADVAGMAASVIGLVKAIKEIKAMT